MVTKYLSSSSYPSQQRDPGQCRGTHFPGMETSGGLLGVGWPLSLTSLNFLVLGVILFLCQSDMGWLVLVTGNQGLGTSELLS